MSQFQFDASQVAPQTAYAPIPEGVYVASITESDVAPTKAGNGGEMLKLTFEILDGEFKGRKVWERLNIKNPNPQTQQIAQSQLSAICHATGVIKLMDTSALHNRPLHIKVAVRPASGGYEASNTIKGFESAVGSAIPAGAAPSTPAANAAPAAPAWARKG